MDGRRQTILAMLMVLTAYASESAAPDAEVIDLKGPGAARSLRAVIEGRATVVMFWRSDCAPCLEELERLEALRRAAEPLQLVTVGLESPESLRAQLQRMSIKSDFAWYSLDDPGEVLSAFGTVPRLPLSVAFDAHGEICARRRGLLTTALIAEWVDTCTSSAKLEEKR
jgi:thiol-disulfide isomerase/thioredoxin